MPSPPYPPLPKRERGEQAGATSWLRNQRLARAAPSPSLGEGGRGVRARRANPQWPPPAQAVKLGMSATTEVTNGRPRFTRGRRLCRLPAPTRLLVLDDRREWDRPGVLDR